MRREEKQNAWYHGPLAFLSGHARFVSPSIKAGVELKKKSATDHPLGLVWPLKPWQPMMEHGFNIEGAPTNQQQSLGLWKQSDEEEMRWMTTVVLSCDDIAFASDPDLHVSLTGNIEKNRHYALYVEELRDCRRKVGEKDDEGSLGPMDQSPCVSVKKPNYTRPMSAERLANLRLDPSAALAVGTITRASDVTDVLQFGGVGLIVYRERKPFCAAGSDENMGSTNKVPSYYTGTYYGIVQRLEYPTISWHVPVPFPFERRRYREQSRPNDMDLISTRDQPQKITSVHMTPFSDWFEESDSASVFFRHQLESITYHVVSPRPNYIPGRSRIRLMVLDIDMAVLVNERTATANLQSPLKLLNALAQFQPGLRLSPPFTSYRPKLPNIFFSRVCTSSNDQNVLSEYRSLFIPNDQPALLSPRLLIFMFALLTDLVLMGIRAIPDMTEGFLFNRPRPH
ncbi:hypothetical protein ACRALDRAFT_212801 [Sodiomyces alcalophilus JCM 7366]|uniref:uncharacterized protein n=1 Tax=Sodiomyces alcalophilus JCM 7366 TaxID=591952 RepID=UPI0039B6CAB1